MIIFIPLWIQVDRNVFILIAKILCIWCLHIHLLILIFCWHVICYLATSGLGQNILSWATISDLIRDGVQLHPDRWAYLHPSRQLWEVGPHTHNDVDHLFSAIAGELKRNEWFKSPACPRTTWWTPSTHLELVRKARANLNNKQLFC